MLRRTVEVEAANEAEATERVCQMYRECRLVLDASDYERTEFSVKDEKSG